MKLFISLITLVTLTLSSFAQAKADELKISWPQEYQWKVISNQEDKTTHFLEMIPGKDTEDKWTLLGTVLSLKNIKISSTGKIVQMYKESSRKESPRAQLTVLEKDETAKNIWVLFKIETESFPDDPKPESQLYYALQGESALYVCFIAIKEKELTNEFVARWSQVFKSSELPAK